MSDPDDYNLIQNKLFNDGRDNLKYWYWASKTPTVIKNGGWDGTNNCVKVENITNIEQSIKCSGNNIGKLFVSVNMKVVDGITATVKFTIISSEGMKQTKIQITDQWQNYYFTSPYLVNKSKFILQIFVASSSQKSSLHMEKLYVA